MITWEVGQLRFSLCSNACFIIYAKRNSTNKNDWKHSTPGYVPHWWWRHSSTEWKMSAQTPVCEREELKCFSHLKWRSYLPACSVIKDGLLLWKCCEPSLKITFYFYKYLKLHFESGGTVHVMVSIFTWNKISSSMKLNLFLFSSFLVLLLNPKSVMITDKLEAVIKLFFQNERIQIWSPKLSMC